MDNRPYYSKQHAMAWRHIFDMMISTKEDTIINVTRANVGLTTLKLMAREALLWLARNDGAEKYKVLKESMKIHTYDSENIILKWKTFSKLEYQTKKSETQGGEKLHRNDRFKRFLKSIHNWMESEEEDTFGIETFKFDSEFLPPEFGMLEALFEDSGIEFVIKEDHVIADKTPKDSEE